MSGPPVLRVGGGPTAARDREVSMSAFTITEQPVGHDVRVIAVSGYVDFDAAPRLKQSIVGCIEAGGSRLVIDLAEAAFIDSTAIGVLVGALKRLNKSGGSLVVVCTVENVQNIFEIVGLEDVIPLHRSRDDAVSALARAA
jgi:anti-sigma B factor antagonist